MALRLLVKVYPWCMPPLEDRLHDVDGRNSAREIRAGVVYRDVPGA